MAELLFKRGKQSALDTIIKNKTGIEGCFYLTEDTNRLYVGQGNGQAPVLLNQVVSVVETESDLPVAPPAVDNDFYYIKSLNVLAVYDSTKKDATHSGWVQINANTNDTVRVTEATFNDGVKSANADSITYTLTLKQKQKDINNKETDLDDITAELVLNSELISGIVPEAAEVGLTASVSDDNELVIATQGAGANSEQKAKVAPGANINITTDANNKIILSATDSIFDQNVIVEKDSTVKSRLTGTNGTQKDISYKAGVDLVVAGDATTDTITYAHKTYNTTSSTSVTNGSDNDGNLVANDKLNIISGIEVSNGHISNISTKELKLPADTKISQVSKIKDWSRTLEETTGGKPVIDFSAEAAALETTLKNEIINKIANANSAMTYKGTVSSKAVLNTKTDVEIGDVWLFSENDSEYKAGDMAIAISSDGSIVTGVIPTEKIKWERIPSGDELNTDTLFKGTVSFDNTSNGSVTYGIDPISQSGQTTIDGNTDITLQAGIDLSISNNEGKALINHKSITTKATTGSAVPQASSITAVTGVATSNGHVTEVTTTTFTPVTYDLAGANNKITMTTSAGGAKDINVAGDSKWISAAVASNALTVSHTGPQEAKTTVTATNNKDLVAGGSLNILSEVKYDEKGHMVGASTSALTLPSDTTYQIKVSSDTAGINMATNTTNPYMVLAGTNGSATHTQIQGSNNLSVVGNQNSIAINMVWGSF